jgi:Fe-S-cluster containining protein
LTGIREIVRQYQALLATVDDWFAGCKAAYDSQIRCAAGCSACCRGLFDITLLDAFLLQTGVARLPAWRQAAIRAKAEDRLSQLRADWSGLDHPYLLNHLPDELWTEMPEDDETPCPLLGEDGACLVYAHRPMICRTHGLPNLDIGGESFSDLCCTLNFPGAGPLYPGGLRWPFRRAFEKELALCGAFTRHLLGVSLREADTFIPLALLIDFSILSADPALSALLPGSGFPANITG